MTTIIGLSGSLRAKSFNTGLLRAAAAAAPAGCTVDIESIRGIPVYDADLEASDPPAAVTALQAKIDAADGLLLVSPEYNNSLPGPFKNAIDWLSSTATGGVKIFRGLPVGLIGASPGPFGTLSAQTAWLTVFRGLAMRPWLGASLYVMGARDKFDGDGGLTDEATRERLAGWMAGFAGFVAAEAGK